MSITIKTLLLIIVFLFGSGAFTVEGVAKMPPAIMEGVFSLMSRQVIFVAVPVRENRVYYKVGVC